VFVLNSVACEWFFFSLFDSSVQTVAYRWFKASCLLQYAFVLCGNLTFHSQWRISVLGTKLCKIMTTVCHIIEWAFYLRPLVDRGAVQAGLDRIFCLGSRTDGDHERSCFANYLLGNSRRWTGYVEWVNRYIWSAVESRGLYIRTGDLSWRKTENFQ
jgi:hypothetical protein